jgi:chromosome segregation ATPase
VGDPGPVSERGPSGPASLEPGDVTALRDAVGNLNKLISGQTARDQNVAKVSALLSTIEGRLRAAESKVSELGESKASLSATVDEMKNVISALQKNGYLLTEDQAKGLRSSLARLERLLGDVRGTR